MIVVDHMTLVVPATECEVNSPHKCQGLVNYDNLFVVSPEQDSCLEEHRMAKELGGGGGGGGGEEGECVCVCV